MTERTRRRDGVARQALGYYSSTITRAQIRQEEARIDAEGRGLARQIERYLDMMDPDAQQSLVRSRSDDRSEGTHTGPHGAAVAAQNLF